MTRKLSGAQFYRVPEQNIILDGLDFGWAKDDIKVAKYLWQKGAKVSEVVKLLRPPVDAKSYRDRHYEVRLLFLHFEWMGRDDVKDD